MDDNWKKQRNVFDTVAELYDEARESYPKELIEDTLAKFENARDVRILEIGAGTGQATRLFAEHDCEILSIEPGSNLASVAARNLANHSKVSFDNCRFEDWTLQEGSFDLVVSASAIFWVDPEIRYKKVSASLKKDGYVAIFYNPNKFEKSIKDSLDEIYSSHLDSSHYYHPSKADPVLDPNFDPDYFGTDIKKSGLFAEPEKKSISVDEKIYSY